MSERIKIDGIDKTNSIKKYWKGLDGRIHVIYKANPTKKYSYRPSRAEIVSNFIPTVRKNRENELVFYKGKIIRNLVKLRYLENSKIQIITEDLEWLSNVNDIYIQRANNTQTLLENESLVINNTRKDVEKIYFFEQYVKVKYPSNDQFYTYTKNDTEIIESKNDLYSNLLDYYYEIAKIKDNSLNEKNDSDIPFLEKQMNNLSVRSDAVINPFFSGDSLDFIDTKHSENIVIYPFGINLSQRKAVKNALNSQLSLIQGPPGTGKTRSILNILANAILNNKTVAVVSGNNEATKKCCGKNDRRGLWLFNSPSRKK